MTRQGQMANEAPDTEREAKGTRRGLVLGSFHNVIFEPGAAFGE